MKKKLQPVIYGNCGITGLRRRYNYSLWMMWRKEPIDELVFRAQHELKMVEDTTKTDCQPTWKTMMLEVGKKCS